MKTYVFISNKHFILSWITILVVSSLFKSRDRKESTGTIKKNRKNLANNFGKETQNRGDACFYSSGFLANHEKIKYCATTDRNTNIIQNHQFG